MDWREVIVSTPGTRSGKPRIDGTRIAVEDVRDWLSSGMSFEEILEGWPYLTHEQLQACIAYDADLKKAASTVKAAA